MKTCHKLINDLEKNLIVIEKEIKNQHYLFEQSIVLCKTTLEKLKDKSIKRGFQNAHEEIEFYKYVKPKAFSYLIFYVEQLHIESKRSKEGKKEQIKYLKRYISQFQTYFHHNLEFYHYYKSNATHLDEQYFLAKNRNIRLNRESYHFFTEDNFSTSHDSSVATIMAYTKLIEYLNNEIQKLNKPHHHMETIHPFQKQSKLNWTGNYNELVELSYALYTSGRINRGNTDIKEIVLAIQNLFNVKNDNYYHTFTELRARKINPTKFMDILKESLTKYMKDLDELNNN